MFKHSRLVTLATELLAVVALAAPAATLSSQAFAGEPDRGTQTHQIRVEFSDIDLSRPDGGEQLLRRLKRAASSACRLAGDRQLHETNSYRRCRAEAVAQAVKDVNRPTLTAAWQGGSSMMAARQGSSGG